MSLHDDLSRLADGDLSDEDAARLRQRIETDPEVAAAWAAMQQLLGDLAALPDLPPPPALNTPLSRPRWPVLLGGLAAAAAVLLLLRPTPAPRIVLVSGQQWVDGQAVVLAGDLQIAVDGKANISVEPPGGGGRETGHSNPEASMNTPAVLAAIAGSAVTIAVYEGQALLSTGDEAPISLTAGQQHTADAITPPSHTAPDPRIRTAQTIARLERELERARSQQDTLALENALNRGQLDAIQGQPAAWPADVPETFTEDFLVEAITAQLADLDSASLERIDCDEYPCMVVLRSTDDRDRWGDHLQEHLAPLMEHYDPEATDMTVNRSAYTHDGQERRFLIFAASEEATTTDEVKGRLDYRMDELIDELGEQVAEELEEGGE